jgi:FkbM family methyltransferase
MTQSAIFSVTLRDTFRAFVKNLLSRPLRRLLNRIPGLPTPYYRFLDEIRFVEPEVVRIISHLVKPGWICADVGAHCGTVSARLAKYCSPGGRVYAFEPIPSNFQKLEARASEFSGIIIARQNAVSDEVGVLKLYEGSHSTTWSSIQSDHSKTAIESPMVTLDAIFAGVRINFIKIDVEGAEALVLRGAQNVIGENRPAILVEFHNEKAWAGAHLLWDLNYRLFDLHGHELRIRSSPADAYCHCLALPA